MKEKQYIRGITFFTTDQMYQKIRNISDIRKMAISEIIREIIGSYLESMLHNKNNC